MNDSTGVARRPRGALSPAARTAAAVIAAAGLTLLAAACSTSSTSSSRSATAAGATSSAAGGSTNAQEVAYSQCVRTHGVPNFPDPPSSGKFSVPSAEQLGVSTPQLQAAENACQSLQPANGGSGGEPTEAMLQQQWRDMRTFAKCMRTHGVTNWPDPTAYPPEPNRGAFNLQSLGIDPNSPTIVPKINVCLAAVHVPQSQSGYIERFVGA